jgi:hypothetical protein
MDRMAHYATNVNRHYLGPGEPAEPQPGEDHRDRPHGLLQGHRIEGDDQPDRAIMVMQDLQP